MKTRKTALTITIFALGFIGAIFASLNTGVLQSQSASADTTGCLGSSCNALPTPTNPGGNTDVKTICTYSKYATWFPTPTNPNLAGALNPFKQCEQSWAASQQPTAAYSPGEYVGNSAADYCHNNFTGGWLHQCINGFGRNGQGSASAACHSNQPACVVGFAVGGNPNQNPHASPPHSVSPSTPVTHPHATPPSSPPINCSKDNCDLIKAYVNPAINLLSAMFGLIAVISLIMGGIQYAASEGDPQKAASAKGRLYNTLIAIFAYLFLYAILQFLIPGGLFNG